MPGASFDRVAEIYDQTRGGQRRGNSFATAIAPWVIGTRIAELGIGTGVIARGLADAGHNVVGFDLSESMMRAALDRIGPQVAVADVDRLPLANNSVDTVSFVWVLQLVDDPADSLREAARVVRPGGRVITVLATADNHPDDRIAAVLGGLSSIMRSKRGVGDISDAAPANLSVEYSGFTSWDEFPGVPNEQADLIEARGFSSLFDVDDQTWETVVGPVVKALRSMPDADKQQTRCNRHPLIVWTKRES